MQPDNVASAPPPLPDYTLLRLVGRGSYGDVWLARSETGLFRAVKIVWRSRFQDIAPYEREFSGLREFARITAGETQQLSLLHVGRNDAEGFFYYVMELADDVVTGREIDPSCYEPLTFRYYREKSIVPPASEVVSQATELARGLVELHSTGHVHRDIKPSNVIVVHGRPKLADIGLVALASQAMTYVGTEGFVPPEGPGTAAADIYSFGKVLYELATGRDRNDFPRLPEDFGQRKDQIALLELNEIILKACAARAEERYATVAAMLGDLQLLEAGRSVRRLRLAEVGLARARKWIAVAAAIATIAAAGAYLERQRADKESAGRRAAEAKLAMLTRRSLYASSIANAQRALETSEYGEARNALAAAVPQQPDEPDLRGFEWQALAREAAGDFARQIGHSTSYVRDISFSPDGRLIAIDDESTDVILYDVETLAPVKTISGIHRLKGFTPDGRRLVGSNPAYAIETWSIEDGSPDPRPNRPGIHRPIAVDSTAPRLLAFVDGDDHTPHQLILRDLTTDQDTATWTFPRVIDERGTEQVFHSAAVDPGLHDALIHLSHLEMGLRRHFLCHVELDHPERPPRELKHQAIAAPIPMGFSTDGSVYVRQPDAEKLALYRTTDDSLIWEIDLPNTRNLNVAFSPNQKWLAATDLDRRLLVLDITNGQTVSTLKGHADLLTAITWSPDSHHLATGTRNGEVRLWPIQPDHVPPVRYITPDSASFPWKALIVEHGSQRALDPRSQNPSVIVDLLTGKITSGATHVANALWFEANQLWWIDTQDRVVSGPADGSVEPIPLALPDDVQNVPGRLTSPDGAWMAFVTKGNELILWDRRAGSLAGRVSLPFRTLTLSVNTVGQVLINNDAQELNLWDVRSGRLLRSVPRTWAPASLVASPDDRWWIAIGTQIGSLVLDAHTLESVAVLGNSHGMINGITFSPDSRTIASGGSTSNVLLFRLEADDRWVEQPFLSLPLLPSAQRRLPVVKVAFTSDGNALVASTSQIGMRIWRR